MQKILVLGAGRSTTSLINYLLSHAKEEGWFVTVGDIDIELAKHKIGAHPLASAIQFDVSDENVKRVLISEADIVISMLPARFHILVAQVCVEEKTDLLTASYVSDDIKALNSNAIQNDVLILMECGLDPGIDHMSAMRVIDRIRDSNGELNHFETFTGGLLAPETEKTTPWEYKFTWNPRNVVMAGQGIVKFIQEGRYKFIPYHKLFKRSEIVEIPGFGFFEGYANRDSLKYLDVYGLRGISTLYRGTFRRPGFCKAWDVFVELGATDDTYEMEGVKEMTHREFINSFLSYNPNDSVELKMAHYLNIAFDDEIMFKLNWIGLFDDELVGLEEGTPAQILECILKKKWTMDTDDRDMIVMWHRFLYTLNGKQKEIHSHMVIEGDNSEETAMAKTVGLPLGIAAKMVLSGKIKVAGVHVPITPDIYNPILSELENAGVIFNEKTLELPIITS